MSTYVKIPQQISTYWYIATINIQTLLNLWDVITNPFPSVGGTTAVIWEWISNLVTSFPPVLGMWFLIHTRIKVNQF